MAGMVGSADSTVPSNMPSSDTPISMTGPPQSSSTSSSVGTPSPFGPDGQYSKAVRKGDIKVEPKLGADNYLTWAEEMWIQLKSKRVLKLVEGTIPPPDAATRPNDFDEWDHDDTNALKWIRANCEKNQLTHLRNKRTSKDAWDALRKIHGVYAKGRINYLLKRFYTYKAGPNDSIDDISSALETFRIQMADIKAEYEPHDALMAIALISAVDDPAYETTKQLLEQEPNLTSEKAKEALKATEQKLKIEKDDLAIEEAHKAGGRRRKGPPPKCDHCGKVGHIRTYCWTWLDTTDEGKEWERTHPEQKRKSKSKSSNPQSPSTSNTQNATSKSTSSSGPRGRSKGAARPAKEDGSDNEASEEEGWMAVDEAEEEIIEEEIEKLESIFEVREGAEAKTSGWMLDSGASRHMTYMRNTFTTFEHYRTAIRIANGHRLWSEGRGNISVDIDGVTVRMTNVLYVPQLDANLLSITALNKKGLDVLFCHNGTVEILRKGTSVATGYLKGRTYFLRTSQVALKASVETSGTENRTERNEDPTTLDRTVTISKENEYRLWHARMAHPSSKRLRELHRCATGIHTFPSNVAHLSCNICNLTKLTRTVNREPFTRSSRLLARVHTDIWGPYRTASLGRHLYFISLIDDFSRKSWLFCLKTRTAIYLTIRDWVKAIEREANLRVAKFRCDNAKEYQKFMQLIRADGIRAEFTTPYTPEQNGVAERYNRTIVQIVRSMLAWAQLPHSFWGEAAVTANYLRNFFLTGDDHLSPEEQWTGQKPDISHLRTFGCLAYVHIPKETRSKLDKVSWQGIFVGYHSTNQYRIYNLEKKKVEWHTSVKFLEDTPGGTILGARKQEDSESLIYPGDSGTDDSSDDDTPQPVSDQVGASKNNAQKPAEQSNSRGDTEHTIPSDSQDSSPLSSPPQSPSQSQADKSSSTLLAPTRHSTRVRKPFDKYGFDKDHGHRAWKAQMDKDLDRNGRKQVFQAPKIFEPQSYKEAIKCIDWRKWLIAIDEELCALIANGTWEYCPRPIDRNIITSKWVFRVKYTYNNMVDRYKARLVARGFAQIFGLDYEETFSPTLRQESLRMLISLAAYFGFEIEQMDVPNAYVKGDLQEEIYMEIPDGLTPPSKYKDYVLRLRKGLYGLKQSGREWNKKISKFLRSIGYHTISGDPCVFVNHMTHVIIGLYVDDLLIFSKSKVAIKEVKRLLNAEYKMKDLGPAQYVLGIRIRRDRKSKRIMLDQSNYIRNFLRDYKMEHANAVLTPLDGFEALSPTSVDEPRTDQLEYQKRIGSIMYAMVCTRPDLAFAVGKLSQYTHDPGVKHRTALDRVLKYLKGTADLALVYDHSTGGDPVSFADAAYGDDLSDRKSTYGHTMLLGNGAVIWASKKQRSVVTSTMEAEYSSMCQAGKDIVWVTRWINELNFCKDINLPITLNGDNQGTLDLIKNPEHHSRSKHIDIQLHYLREVINDGYATAAHVPTREMVADIFTKPLAAPMFKELRSRLGVQEVDNTD